MENKTGSPEQQVHAGKPALPAGRYFKYAIGEIILVVIGILIALSINNWNEDRKNASLIKTYKMGLINNLKKDSLLLSQRIDKITSELVMLIEFEERVAASAHPLDTILKIARFEYPFLITLKYDFEDDTYNALNSTGDISLFEDSLIKDLNELFNLQERSLFTSRKTFETYRNAMSLYARDYPFSFKTNLIQNGTLAADMIWNNISLPQHATEFNALVIAKGDSYRLALDNLPLVLEKTNDLLANLRDN